MGNGAGGIRQSLCGHTSGACQLNQGLRNLTASVGYAPTRAMMQQVMDRMGDRDGNFVQQFQTDGFDARTWELYLHATLSDELVRCSSVS
jgi:hypothetical protein